LSETINFVAPAEHPIPITISIALPVVSVLKYRQH